MLKRFLRLPKLANRPRIAPSPFGKLKLEQLEARDVPALWAVGMNSPWTGTPGDTAATISGPLSYASQWLMGESGSVLVEAASAGEAVALAFAGTITVQFGSETLNYQMGPSAFAAAGPFRYLDGAIQLEDMAYSTFGSDFDYNDRFWMVTTTPMSGGGSSQSYGYPTFVWITAGADTSEISDSDAWFVVHRNNNAGPLTVNFNTIYTGSGAAVRDEDYTVLGNGISVTFADLAWTATVSVRAVEDGINDPVEATETVKMALIAGSGYTVYSPNQATILIYNNIAQIDLDVTNNGQL